MNSPFDHRQDRELGAALRAALDPGDQPAFVERVTSAAVSLTSDPAGAWWSVIGPWARPGMTAALVIVAGVGAWLGSSLLNGTTPSLEDPLVGANGQLAIPALLADQTTPDVDYVLGVALGQ